MAPSSGSLAKAPAGYSGKPIAAKLGFKAGQRVLFLALPPALAELAEGTEFASVSRLEWGAELDAPRYDMVHAFTTRQADLEAHLPKLQAAIARDGTIWVSWPKKASKVATDVTENTVRDTALALDLVDVKVAAIDEMWSGLKLVIRKERRGTT